MARSQQLQKFLQTTQNAFSASGAKTDALVVADKIFSTADAKSGIAAKPEAAEVPACKYLGVALESAKAEGGPVANLALALEGIAPHLKWGLRPNGENDDLVDSMTQALMRYRQGNFVQLPTDDWENEENSARVRLYY